MSACSLREVDVEHVDFVLKPANFEIMIVTMMIVIGKKKRKKKKNQNSQEFMGKQILS